MVIPISRQMESIVDSTMFIVTTSMTSSAACPGLGPPIVAGSSGGAQGRESHRVAPKGARPIHRRHPRGMLGQDFVIAAGGDDERPPPERRRGGPVSERRLSAHAGAVRCRGSRADAPSARERRGHRRPAQHHGDAGCRRQFHHDGAVDRPLATTCSARSRAASGWWTAPSDCWAARSITTTPS